MPYAITWYSTDEPPRKKIGPILYKYVDGKKNALTRKKVPMTKDEANAKCDSANDSPIFGNIEHSIIRVKSNYKQEGENIVEKISSKDSDFWRENFDKMFK